MQKKIRNVTAGILKKIATLLYPSMSRLALMSLILCWKS